MIDAETVAILRERLLDPPNSSGGISGDQMIVLLAGLLQPGEDPKASAQAAFQHLAAVVGEYNRLRGLAKGV